MTGTNGRAGVAIALLVVFAGLNLFINLLRPRGAQA